MRLETIANECKKLNSSVVDLAKTPLFYDALENFGPALKQKNAKIDLKTIYEAYFHVLSGSLLIANKGVSIISLSPFSSVNYITRHIACSLYQPGLGVETANIGFVGDVYSGDVILRAESACPPAFIFGSQRCNCSYQWASIRELAAHFNPIITPKGLSDEALEHWVETHFTYKQGKHLSTHQRQGLILMHLDSQAGMGSGFTEGEFCFDLYNRAVMRQLGENTTEQVHHTTLKEGYEAIGVMPDSRKGHHEAGYRTPAIILECLDVSKNLIVLSNNKFKLGQLVKAGFHVKRVKSLGKIDGAGAREAKQRGQDFDHLDMDGEELTFDQEITRLKQELVFS